MSPRLQVANRATTTLNGNIADDAVSLTLTSSALFPSAPFRITIGSEIIEVGAINKTTHVASSLLRAQEGTSAAAHLNGATVTNRWTKGAVEELVGTDRTVSTTAPLAGGGALSANLTLTHADTAGYKHIPTAGAAEQWLKYSASGTAAWATLLGETSATAYRGDRGKTAYDYSQVGHVPLTRTVSTTTPLAGGGALSGDLTLTHVDTTGYKHIPSGGASGQFLKYSADGTAAWDSVPGGLALGETDATAYRGDRGKTAYDHSQVSHAYLPLAGGTMAGETIFADQLATRPMLKDYSETTVVANTGTSYAIDLTGGNVFELTLTGNCVFTFTNPPASGSGGSFMLILKQDGTGSRTTTWPNTVKWAAGTAPTLTTTASAEDVLTFVTTTAGTAWYGFLGGLAFAVPA